MNLPTLYRVEEELLALHDTTDLVEEHDQRLAILAEIAEANAAALNKRDGVARFLNLLQFRLTSVDEEIGRLQDLKQRWGNEKRRFEGYVISVIERFVPEPKRGPKKLEGNTSVLSLAKNPDSVEITNSDLVPLKFKDVTIRLTGDEYSTLLSRLDAAGLFDEGVLLAGNSQSTARKADIKRALASGAEVAGADLKFGSQRLVVR